MAIASVLRQVMADRITLAEHVEGNFQASVHVLLRRLVDAEQAQARHLPYHYHANAMSTNLKDIGSLRSLLTDGLVRLAASHLELVEGVVRVKNEMMSDWQELLTLCPPSPLVAALLWKEKFPKTNRTPAALRAFMDKWIVPNFRNSALPPLGNDRFREERVGGYSDLHIHLNQSLEVDLAWSLCLKAPDLLHKLLEKETEEMQKQNNKDGGHVESDRAWFIRLIKSALRARDFATKAALREPHPKWAFYENTKRIAIENLLRNNPVSLKYPEAYPNTTHPLSKLFRATPGGDPSYSELSLDAMFHVLAIDSIAKHSKIKDLSLAYHHYLLALGEFNRRHVQQTWQKGFEHFQKVAHSGMRSTLRVAYEKVFAQLAGNDLRNLRFVEGRVSPSLDDSGKSVNPLMIHAIIDGYDAFLPKVAQETGINTRLKLVWHFRKRKDEATSENEPITIRNLKYRHQVSMEAMALSSNYGISERAVDLTVGVDAAGNELFASPENFGPAFGYLRNKGVKRFTYHAGEDFYNPVGGMRAVFEAVEFLGFKPGDRIGHATAAGIDPRLWRARIDGDLYLPRGEWLDDLIFARYMLFGRKQTCSMKCCSMFQAVLTMGMCSLPDGLYKRLLTEIRRLSVDVYGRCFPIRALEKAWLLRRHCPERLLEVLRGNILNTTIQSVAHPDEWRQCVAAINAADDSVKHLVRAHHEKATRARHEEPIRLAMYEFPFCDAELTELQRILLNELYGRGIVLETLPTSNVRISFYKKLEEHHLFRWLKIGPHALSFDKVPPIVVGTDDPGVFATNISNEYGQIFNTLVGAFKYTEDQAASVVRMLEENAEKYSFG